MKLRHLTALGPLLVTLLTAWILAAPEARATVTIQVGAIAVPPSTTVMRIPILVTGGDLVTDMVGYFQIGDGGPLVGGTDGPKITNILFDGSIWASAPGGYNPSRTVVLPREITDQNVSLIVPGQKVAASGLLCTLLVDVTGFRGAVFNLSMVGVSGGNSTAFQNAGVTVPATITNGTLAVEPRFLVRSETNGSVTLTFSSLTGRTYLVQYKDALGSPTWTDAISINGVGGLMLWTDDGTRTGAHPAAIAKRFYRIRFSTSVPAPVSAPLRAATQTRLSRPLSQTKSTPTRRQPTISTHP